MPQSPLPPSNVRIDRAMPMDAGDGVRLLATVYRPMDDSPCPVFLMRTPYGKDLSPAIHVIDPEKAVDQGFMVVVQDVRGRHGSGGNWNPYVSEAEDGARAVEWAAKLPGADGRVCLYGSSYQGAAAIAAASLRPPSLCASAPMLCWGDAACGQTFRGGALEIGKLVRWTLMNMGDRLARRIADPVEAERMIAQCAADLAALG
ncbi:MAG: CocE/NonD family hydrolase, partial [Sphingobium sp.]